MDKRTDKDEEREFLKLMSQCVRCKYFSYKQVGVDFICAVHPEGKRNCPDFERRKE